MSLTARVDAIDALLPQTQCTRCGYADCRSYATAIVEDAQAINRCPPGGEEGMRRLAQITGREPSPLDASCGQEGPLRLAVIDETWCIGCTLCIKACPVDCIVGANKLMHTVIADQCTGCELCIPACPVDCISLVDVTPGKTGWAAWSEPQALLAQQRYRERTARREQSLQDQAARRIEKAELKREDLAAHTHGGNEDEMARKRRVIDAALARARAKRTDA